MKDEQVVTKWLYLITLHWASLSGSSRTPRGSDLREAARASTSDLDRLLPRHLVQPDIAAAAGHLQRGPAQVEPSGCGGTSLQVPTTGKREALPPRTRRPSRCHSRPRS